jgi:hypothetical protein
MLMLFESLAVEFLSLSPDLVLFFGTPAISNARPKRFLTVRSGRHSALVEAN